MDYWLRSRRQGNVIDQPDGLLLNPVTKRDGEGKWSETHATRDCSIRAMGGYELHIAEEGMR